MLKDTFQSVRCWYDNNRILLLILSIAFLIRLYLAVTLPYIEVEWNEYIPLAESISLHGDRLNLPIRGWHHPALPAYLIEAGSLLLGKHPVGFRFFGIITGVFMIAVASRLANIWGGPVAAHWTAALLAFNEYHIGVSVMVGDIVYYYAFAMLALYFFCLFLQNEAPKYLYASSVMIGLGYLCREIVIIFVPIFFAYLFFHRDCFWFKRKEPYLAFFIILLVIAPDLYWNVTAKENQQVRLVDQLSRVGGIGFTPDYLLFYTRDIFRRFGWEYFDGYAEFPTMNLVFGTIFMGCVFRETLHFKREDPIPNLMLLTFWGILAFFMLIHPSMKMSPRLEDNIGWLWIDLTLLPAVLLTGGCVARLKTPWKVLVYIAMTAGILYAIARVVMVHSMGQL
jgi:4-amino-4-deoxy-L-arabinose transferase-like glycosyltransferase